MSVTTTGSQGLFTRLGSLIYTLNTVDTFRYSTMDTRVTDLYNEFTSTDQRAIDNLFSNRDSYRSVHDSFVNQLFATAQNIVITQVDRTETLSNKTLLNALQKLIMSMNANTEYISGSTLGATFTAVNNVNGQVNSTDAKFAAYTLGTDGRNEDALFAETIDFTCTGGTAYNESFTFNGDPAVPTTAYNWPQGSGCSGNITLTNAANATKVTDGAFETWVDANTPTYWTALTGVGGTNFIRSSSSQRGSYAMQLISDGSTLTTLYQDITTQLLPNTLYALCFWAKIDTNDASGILRMRLVDGTNTAITTSYSGVTSATFAMNGGSGIGTSYGAQTAFFLTPKVLPSTVRFQFGFSTSPGAARTVNIDLLGFTTATQLYVGGPWVGAFSGSSTGAVGDSFLLTTTNSQGVSSFIRSLDRLFNTRQLGIKFPTSGITLVNNSLIA